MSTPPGCQGFTIHMWCSTFIHLCIQRPSGIITHLIHGEYQSMTTGIIMAGACRGTTGRAASAGLTGGAMIHGGITIPGWATGGIHGMPRGELRYQLLSRQTLLPLPD